MIRDYIRLEPEILTILKELNNRGFKPLLIGGCVRDAYLNIKPKDVDIEVYNICYEDLINFLSKYGTVDLVGKKFGVIVFNPYGGKMKYDFSIPRTESKSGVGHKEFSISLLPTLSVKEAASRRDYTMNAIAYDPITDELHDYYGGIDDINNKIIRHTSDAFEDDYLRILRGMNFQSRFGFDIHPTTIAKMKAMLTSHVLTIDKEGGTLPNNLSSNEFTLLAKERICEEWTKWSERGKYHDLIFKFMRDTGLIEYYPELKALKETPQDEVWHSEGDVEIHTTMCLEQIDRIVSENNITGKEKVILIFSVLLHDVAKPNTSETVIKGGRSCITSHGHEALGGEMSIEFLQKLGFNEELYLPISKLIANHLAGVSISLIKNQSGKVKAVKKLSRRLYPATIQQLLFLMDADTNGRGTGSDEYKEPTGAKEIREIAEQIDVTEKQYQYILMGRHIIEETGLQPSERFGVILKASYEAQENGEFSDLDGAKKWLANYLNPKLSFKQKVKWFFIYLLVNISIIPVSVIINSACMIAFKNETASYLITFVVVFTGWSIVLDYLREIMKPKKRKK